MKKFSSIFAITVVAVLLLAVSCGKKRQEQAYYCFTSADYLRLLSYTEGQVLKFTNPNNEERTFAIQNVNIEKIQLVYTGFLNVNLFSYDKKVITLIDSETKGEFYIGFSRRPIDDNSARQNTYTKYPSELYAAIVNMPFWNGDVEVSIDYEQKKTEMTFNGKTYRNVFVFASGNDSILKSKRDVNIVYYDEIGGIIGFDDLNNNKWRLIN